MGGVEGVGGVGERKGLSWSVGGLVQTGFLLVGGGAPVVGVGVYLFSYLKYLGRYGLEGRGWMEEEGGKEGRWEKEEEGGRREEEEEARMREFLQHHLEEEYELVDERQLARILQECCFATTDGCSLMDGEVIQVVSSFSSSFDGLPSSLNNQTCSSFLHRLVSTLSSSCSSPSSPEQLCSLLSSNNNPSSFVSSNFSLLYDVLDDWLSGEEEDCEFSSTGEESLHSCLVGEEEERGEGQNCQSMGVEEEGQEGSRRGRGGGKEEKEEKTSVSRNRDSGSTSPSSSPSSSGGGQEGGENSKSANKKKTKTSSPSASSPSSSSSSSERGSSTAAKRNESINQHNSRNDESVNNTSSPSSSFRCFRVSLHMFLLGFGALPLLPPSLPPLLLLPKLQTNPNPPKPIRRQKKQTKT